MKIAILVERYAPDRLWYMSQIFSLMNTAGDFVSDNVWWKLMRIVTTDESLHEIAAKKAYLALLKSSVPEAVVKASATILGEFGYMLVDDDGTLGVCSPMEMFGALHRNFRLVSDKTQCILLTCYIKLLNLFSELDEVVLEVLDLYSGSLSPELATTCVRVP